MSIRHITALIIVALGPAVQAAEKSILFEVGESYEGPALGTRPLVSATDAGDVYSWYESGPSFNGEIYTLGGGIQAPVSFVSGGVGLSDDSDTADIILANRFNRVIPFSFRGGGSTFGLCVGYEARLASDPTNPLHLLETCEIEPGQFETKRLLSPGEVIDGATGLTVFVLDVYGQAVCVAPPGLRAP